MKFRRKREVIQLVTLQCRTLTSKGSCSVKKDKSQIKLNDPSSRHPAAVRWPRSLVLNDTYPKDLIDKPPSAVLTRRVTPYKIAAI